VAFDVFISYSSIEKPVAESLCAMIENAGISCWIAPRNVVPGAHWAASIAQAVRNARLLVLLFSENASVSTQVAREVALADAHRLAILPIKIDAAIPDNVLEYYLSVCHWLDVSKKKIEDAESEIVGVARQYLGLRTATAMPEEALLDIYDSDMNQIGTAKRSGVHREGLWHKTMHCWFISRHGGEPCVWFQKRSEDKSDFPALFDITAGRHILTNESDRDAVGKINQELGVSVSFDEVRYIGVRTYSEKIDEFFNREFNAVYIYDGGKILEHAVPNPKEVSGIIRLNVDEAMQLFSSDAGEAQAAYFANNEQRNTIVKISDFVPRSDHYYQTICRLAKGYFDNSTQLAL
jgi:isopentenyldiphosphate isomerase